MGATVIGAVVVAVWFTNIQPEIPALAVSAVAGAIWYRQSTRSMVLAIALPVGFWPDLTRMALSLLKIGATLFGSGYVLISYLQSDFVDHYGWLTQQQLGDAIAVGQFTPGPLLTSATFVGYLLGHDHFGGGVTGGIIGGIVATIAIFLPSFVLVAIFGPLLQRIRANPLARGALNGMNAAVVGLMVVVALRLTWAAVYIPTARRAYILGILILVATFAGLWRKINSTWLILAAGVLGAAGHLIGVP
jgi:chromate transporter